MTLIKERWDKSDDVDEDVRQCVSKYLAERESFPAVTSAKLTPDVPGRMEIAKSVGTYDFERRRSGDSTKDFWIFLALLAVAAILLMSLIPALLCCLALRARRKRRTSSLSTLSGRSSGRSSRTAGGKSVNRRNYKSAKNPATAKSGTTPISAIKKGWSRLSQKSSGKSFSTTTPGSGSRSISSKSAPSSKRAT
ncbi:hypothetical protein OESDEN_19975 [Oesophagostomum dentatum]|uniref:Uncharacterized protein n=1 Tax=Oesophagostomum dentatum TaxID=61180 RepID=A0A0B1S8W3_OESDE|nr:hypothetical protein OESDEN_19975 [Oesophagostomum dentatum]